MAEINGINNIVPSADFHHSYWSLPMFLDVFGKILAKLFRLENVIAQNLGQEADRHFGNLKTEIPLEGY